MATSPAPQIPPASWQNHIPAMQWAMTETHNHNHEAKLSQMGLPVGQSHFLQEPMEINRRLGVLQKILGSSSTDQEKWGAVKEAVQVWEFRELGDITEKALLSLESDDKQGLLYMVCV